MFNDNIKNLALNATYQLCLFVNSLKMKRTNYTLVRNRVENLGKIVFKAVSLKNFL